VYEPQPQTAAGMVHFAFTMSVDGFVAGGHSMDFMQGTTQRPGLVQEYMGATGAVLAGRDGYDSAIGDFRPYGAAWKGPIFVLTHHPKDARPAEDITGLIDDIDLHIAPVLLGDGVRLYDAPGGDIIRLERDGPEPTLAANLRYRPVRTAAQP
jgi:dihydrofolate reductase